MFQVKSFSSCLSCSLALLGAVVWGRAQSPAPEFMYSAVLESGYLVATFRCPSNEWMVIEVSADLRVWSELENVKYRRQNG